MGAAVAVLALAPAGCGSDDNSSTSPSSSSGRLVVSAAASLQKAFTQYGRQFDDGRVRFSFAGSDELAAQIRQGVKPDVFASAKTKLATLDRRHFSVVRPAHVEAFDILPSRPPA